MERFRRDPSEDHLQRALDEIDDMCKVWRRGRREDLFLARAVGSGLLESRANQQLYALLREWGVPSYMDHASALKVVLFPLGDADAGQFGDVEDGSGGQGEFSDDEAEVDQDE